MAAIAASMTKPFDIADPFWHCPSAATQAGITRARLEGWRSRVLSLLANLAKRLSSPDAGNRKAFDCPHGDYC